MKKRNAIILSLIILSVLTVVIIVLCFTAKVNFSLLGSENNESQVFSEYNDEGCKAKFLCFDISDKIKTSSDVNSEKLGEYTVSYTLNHLGKTYSLQRSVSVIDTTPPVIELSGDVITVSSMDFYKEPGYSAFDNYDGDVSGNVSVNIGNTENGLCVITYTVSDSYGNTANAQRTVTVKDIIPPTLTLSGGEELEIYTPTYTEAGYIATDDLDGDITQNVTVSTDYQSGKEGSFTFEYTVSDSSGNTSSAKRRVTVRDTSAPVITLKGGSVLYMYTGGTYAEQGFSAFDAFDGDVSANVTVNGTPDTNVAGAYRITYSASDTKGNTTSAQRTVYIIDKPEMPTGLVNGEGVVSASTIYLTFDDGPSNRVTPRVLDILKKNNVKATFFIINYSDANKSVVARMIAEGHTVGIHGYSHDYSVLYTSEEAFINNIEKLRKRLIDDFGYNTNLIRFPGGSSNLVSKKYNSGIMSRLCPLMESMGYSYFDWNITSGDAAGGTASSSAIYNNVIKGLRHGRGNIVLMHDTNAKGTTADALQSIIDFGKANGYTFAALSSGTDGAHHGIQN